MGDMSENVISTFVDLTCPSHNRRKRDIGEATGRNHQYRELPLPDCSLQAIIKEYTTVQQRWLFICWCSVLSFCFPLCTKLSMK